MFSLFQMFLKVARQSRHLVNGEFPICNGQRQQLTPTFALTKVLSRMFVLYGSVQCVLFGNQHCILYTP